MIPVYFALIAMAGGLGAVIRFLASAWVGKLPWGILAVNTAAAFIVGAVLRTADTNAFYTTLVITGLCGGLSTFSSFSAQTVEYFKAKQIWRGLANTALNFVLPTVAALAGLYIFGILLK